MSNPTGTVTTITTTKFDWKDKLKILFGGRLVCNVRSEVEYRGDDSKLPFKFTSLRTNSRVHFNRPKWMKKKIGYCAPEAT